jgi:hypothetical protein
MGGVITTGLVKGSKLTLSVAGSANVALTTDQAQNAVHEYTGALTGNINVTIPDAVATGGAKWTIFNNTTGLFTLTVKTVSGTGVVVQQGQKAELYSDATNLVAGLTPEGMNAQRGGRSALTYTADSNKTLVEGEYDNYMLDFTNAGTSLGATRNAVVPLTPAGRSWLVRNNAPGAQSIQVIGASGTGITIATSKYAVVMSDGTNILRVTPDT